jgi:hypothetical protein
MKILVTQRFTEKAQRFTEKAQRFTEKAQRFTEKAQRFTEELNIDFSGKVKIKQNRYFEYLRGSLCLPAKSFFNVLDRFFKR